MAKSKKAAPKKAGKKAAPKKAASKSNKPKKKAIKKAAPENVTALPGEEQPVVATGNCFCMEKNGLFFCMRKMKNGSFKECPTLAAFETLEECQQHSCP